MTHTTDCLARVNKSFTENRRDALLDAHALGDSQQASYILETMNEDNRPMIVAEWLRDGTATCTCAPEPVRQWSLIIVPAKSDMSPYLIADAIRAFITETEESSEDVTVSVIAGVVMVTAWWAGSDWCWDLRHAVEDVMEGVRCWVASR